MTRMKCEECGKSYTYEVDDFCPRCGAYNQPRASAGAVVRVDGIAEKNHTESFTHEEIHREKVQRRVLNLDQDMVKTKKRVWEITKPLAGAGERKKQGKTPALIAVLVWLFIIIEVLITFFS